MKTEREYVCPACGSIMEIMGPPNESLLCCPNDRWIHEIEKYDEWVEWYRAYHDNPDCIHENLELTLNMYHYPSKNVADETMTFAGYCGKCRHTIHVTISKDRLDTLLNEEWRTQNPEIFGVDDKQ